MWNIVVGATIPSISTRLLGRLKSPSLIWRCKNALLPFFLPLTQKLSLSKKINDSLEEKDTILFKQSINEFINMRPIHSFGHVITRKTPLTSGIEYYGNDILFIKTPDMHRNVYVTTSGKFTIISWSR